MSKKDKDEIPATEGTLGEQGGTSQPGPPTDPEEDAVGEVDFETPADGSTGTENTKR